MIRAPRLFADDEALGVVVPGRPSLSSGRDHDLASLLNVIHMVRERLGLDLSNWLFGSHMEALGSHNLRILRRLIVISCVVEI